MAEENLTAKDVLQNVADNVANKLQLDPKKFSDKLISLLAKELSGKFTKSQLDKVVSNVSKKDDTKSSQSAETSDDKKQNLPASKSLLEKNKEVQKTEITNFKELQTILPTAFKESLRDVNDHLKEMSKVMKTLPALLKQISTGGNGSGGLFDTLSSLTDLIPGRKFKLPRFLRKPLTALKRTGRKIFGTGASKAGRLAAAAATGAAVTSAAGAATKTVATEAAGAATKTVATGAGKGVAATVGKEIAKEATVLAVEQEAKKGIVSGIKAKISSSIAKRIPKALGGAIAKSVPAVGAAIGAAFAIPRLLRGDYVGAALEAGSGVGSAATAIPLTIALIAKDVYTDVYGIAPEKDPEAGNRLTEVKDSVTEAAKNFLTSNAKPGPEASKPPEIVPEPVKEAIEKQGNKTVETSAADSNKNIKLNEAQSSTGPKAVTAKEAPKVSTPAVTPEPVKEAVAVKEAPKAEASVPKESPAPAVTPEPVKEAVAVKEAPKTVTAKEAPKVSTPAVTPEPVKQYSKPEVSTSKEPTANITPSISSEQPQMAAIASSPITADTPKTAIEVPEPKKSDANQTETLKDIASNTRATNSILGSLVNGFNNLVRALEKAGISGDQQAPIIINKGTPAPKTPSTQMAISGNRDISNFRSTTVEGARFQPI